MQRNDDFDFVDDLALFSHGHTTTVTCLVFKKKRNHKDRTWEVQAGTNTNQTKISRGSQEGISQVHHLL